MKYYAVNKFVQFLIMYYILSTVLGSVKWTVNKKEPILLDCVCVQDKRKTDNKKIYKTKGTKKS